MPKGWSGDWDRDLVTVDPVVPELLPPSPLPGPGKPVAEPVYFALDSYPNKWYLYPLGKVVKLMAKWCYWRLPRYLKREGGLELCDLESAAYLLACMYPHESPMWLRSKLWRAAATEESPGVSRAVGLRYVDGRLGQAYVLDGGGTQTKVGGRVLWRQTGI